MEPPALFCRGFPPSLTALAVCLAVSGLAAGDLRAQSAYARDRTPLFRWTGSSDWEVYQTNAMLDGVETTFNSFRQKYSVDMHGAIWDPRFNQLSLGVDLVRTDRTTDGQQIDSKAIGYRAITTFFPSRPFPLHVYARSSVTDVSGARLAGDDREDRAWGLQWSLNSRAARQIDLSYDRTSFNLTSPLQLKERTTTGAAGFMQSFDNGKLSVRYNAHREDERVSGSQFTRRTFMADDYTDFANGSSLRVNVQHALSNARFISGSLDDLTLTQVSTVYDVPRGTRTRLTMNYLFNGTDGKFVDSTSHVLGGRATVDFATHWQSATGLELGRVSSDSSAGPIEQDRAGVRAGLRYTREWERLRVVAGAGAGYSEEQFNILPDRQVISWSADTSARVSMTARSDLFGTASVKSDDNDVKGVGYSYDEERGTLGVESRYDGQWRLKNEAFVRRTLYDTFQFGIQESREYGLENTLSNTVGSFSLSYSSRKGISDFVPDPGISSGFLPGTDLTSQADIVSLGANWRPTPRVSLMAQGRLEHRTYTTIGVENIAYYQSEARYQRNTWTITARFSHYERNNDLDFSDDTWLLKIGKLFY